MSKSSLEKDLTNKISSALPSPDQNKGTRRVWWSRTGSNRRPEACKATALPTELRPRNESHLGKTLEQQDGGPGKI